MPILSNEPFPYKSTNGSKNDPAEQADLRFRIHQIFAGNVLQLFLLVSHQLFGVWGSRSGVWGLGFGVWGLGFEVCGLGFGVWGSGVGI